MKKRKKEDLFRPVTHPNKIFTSEKGWLPREIDSLSGIQIKADDKGFVDEDIWDMSFNTKLTTIITGSVSLVSMIMFSLSNEELTFFPILVWSIAIFFFVASIIYYFTMPKKEIIFNRKEGIITLPGSFWRKNFTMPFDNVDFTFTMGGHNGIGAYRLRYLGPENIGSYGMIGFPGNCWEELSFITWYMDRNRPLPPDPIFDPFRERDFQRRKAEGFPPPLYPSKIPTPEATPEQQKERNKYWRDEHYRNYGTSMDKIIKTPVTDKWIERH